MSGNSALSADQRAALAELMRISPIADEIGARFAAAGHELHLVGGTVRDVLLGRLGSDLDFATSARPEQTQDILRGWAEAIWTTGADFGT
ncbi:MAG TPA: CCA tRNA nucleotidyltransferase, partial [Micromonosporaceae bacterium]